MELERITSSKVFSRSDRMKRFLNYAVEQSFLNSDGAVKEYAVALAVYDKTDSFDPRIDPIVRVEASRLRAKLREYYEDDGQNDPILISIRKKGYSAVCKKRRPRPLANPASSLAQGMVPGFNRNPEAQHLYLRGRHYWNQRNPEAITRAMECLKEAISMDSQYAHAYAGLADCYVSQAWLEVESPSQVWLKAQENAQKALAINASLAQAITALACKDALFHWDWEVAEGAFRRAIALNPRYATARHWYAFFCLAPQRRLSAALNELAKACELDPLSSPIGTHLGSILYYSRRYNEAIDQFQRAVEIDPGFPLAYWHMGLAYAQLLRYDDAIRVLNQSRDLGHSTQATAAALGFVYAKMGDRPSAEKMVSDLEGLLGKEYVSPMLFALVHAALDNQAAAFQWLDKAIEARSSRIVHLKVDPAFDKLKSESRFLSTLSSLNLLRHLGAKAN